MRTATDSPEGYMLERMARVLTGAMNQSPVSDEQWQQALTRTEDMETLFGWCRAILQAMREPTAAMVDAGRYAKNANTGAADFGQFDNDLAAWQAMIDAALGAHP